MLAPILPEILAWAAAMGRPVPPPAAACLSHFGQRARLRGVQDLHGDLLKWGVERALALERGDLVEPVFRLCPVSRLVRVMLPLGPVYPVIVGLGTAATLYRQDQVRSLRLARRQRKRWAGRRAKRAAP